MALLPYVIDNFSRSLNLHDQNFGENVGVNDYGAPCVVDAKGFSVNIDVQHFKPHELIVKTADNYVTVEGKHEEDVDEHGFISRHFVRRYVLPEDIDMDQVRCNVSTDGVLCICGPKKSTAMETDQRDIPIVLTQMPAVKNAAHGPTLSSFPDPSAMQPSDGSSCSCS